MIIAILSRELDEFEYATFRQTLLTYKFLAPVLAMGIPGALLYFLPNQESRWQGILIESILVLLCVGMLFLLFFLLGGNHLIAASFGNPMLKSTLIWFSPYCLFTLPVLANNASLIAAGFPKKSALFVSISQITMATLVIGSAACGFGVLHIVKIVVLHSFLACFVSFLLLKNYVKSSESNVSLGNIKSMLKYSIPLAVGTAVAYLNMNLDKVVVASWLSPPEFALYVNGAFEIPLIGILTGAASAIILPDMAKYFKKRQMAKGLSLWKRASAKTAALLFPMTVVLWLLAPELMVILYGEKYESSAVIFRWYILLIPIRSGFYSVIYQSCGQSMKLLRRAAMALTINLILTIPMTMTLGISGAAISTIIVSWVVMVPYNSYECAKMLGDKVKNLYPWKQLGLVCLSSFAILIVCIILIEISERYFGDLIEIPLVKLILVGGSAVILIPIAHCLAGVWSVSTIKTHLNRFFKPNSRVNS